MMLYPVIKDVHLTFVALSFLGFMLRGFWMLRGSPWLDHRLSRILPHVVDTVLLGSAVWLTVLLRQYPFESPWLTAKLMALVVYIVLGGLALRRAKTKTGRVAALVGAAAVFFYMVAVALSHDPLPLGLISM